MLTTGELWEFADQVYTKNQAMVVAPTGFVINRFDISKSFFGRGQGRDGFQAAVYENQSRLGVKVVAIAGTQGAALNDITADLRAGLHVMPRQASSAWKFYESVVLPTDEFVFITGHSLGGALAQVVGYWANCPFVTFNAPGMASVLGAAQWNFLKPDVRKRSRDAAKFRDSKGEARGINFRISGDPIGKLGRHVGEVIVLKSSRGLIKDHSDLEPVLRNTMVNSVQSLYDVDPFLMTEAHWASLA